MCHELPMTTTPLLRPLQFEPERCRASAEAFRYLERIETIDVRTVRVVDGATQFVVEVYFQQSQSRIPTVMQRFKSHQLTTKDIVEGSKRRAPRHVRTPDAVLLRSFSQFAELRRSISSRLDEENRGNCRSCNEWMSFLMFNMWTSEVMMKMLPLASMRRPTLDKFMKAAVLLGIQATVKPTRRQMCPVGDSIAQLLTVFLQDAP